MCAHQFCTQYTIVHYFPYWFLSLPSFLSSFSSYLVITLGPFWILCRCYLQCSHCRQYSFFTKRMLWIHSQCPSPNYMHQRTMREALLSSSCTTRGSIPCEPPLLQPINWLVLHLTQQLLKPTIVSSYILMLPLFGIIDFGNNFTIIS